MDNIIEKLQETTAFLKQRGFNEATVGVVLGSGLGSFINLMEIERTISYNDIPHFPVSTVEFHKGQLLLGTIGNKKVIAMQGRFHFYEGYDMKQVTFPVRVMKYLGITKLVVSNASGGVNSHYEVGSVVIIKDHINMFPEHPLHGKNDERFGPRFLNMNEAYNKAMIQKAKSIATENGIIVHDGVYLGLQGPTFETFAEYKMVKILGADCVGMSTVPEVIVARHMGIECFGLSVITDMGDFESSMEDVSHDEVLKAAAKAEPQVRKLIKELIVQF